jgi:hypothetical protein
MAINKKELLRGTVLIKSFFDKNIDLITFNNRYDNFYYYNALDGHEGPIDLRYLNHVELHKVVQEILDSIYWDTKPHEVIRDRISPSQGEQKLFEALSGFVLDELISDLTD